MRKRCSFGRITLFLAFLLLALLLLAAFAVSGIASSADAVWPVASGTDVRADGKLKVDASHAVDGYVMVCTASSSKNRMKVRVTYGDTQLMYDLDNSGAYEVFPLQQGSGRYDIALFENVKGSKYASEGKVSLSVQLNREDAAFLVANQYVNYLPDALTVQKSDEITAGLSSQADIYKTVQDFMTREFMYDFVRASTIPAGALPEVDPCFEKRSGICQDLAAVMVCMLRVQGVPARLMIGYADKYYHAWTTAIVDGQEVFFDPTAALGAMKAKTYQDERFY